MTSHTGNPKWMTILGWFLTAGVGGMLAFSASMKFAGGADFEKFFVGHFGYPKAAQMPIALAEAGCVLFLLFPKTAVLGAILVTGYMGGAMATHIRVSEPWIVQLLFGAAAWLGVFLREPRLRQILPLIRSASIAK